MSATDAGPTRDRGDRPTPSTAVLRAAVPGDVDAVMALERASFPTDAWSTRQMADELRSRYGHYVVAEDGGVVVGYAGFSSLPGGTDGDVQTIAVAAAERGRGLGRRLFRALLDEARRRGVHEVFLEVRADNPVAQAMYTAHGFEHIATRPRYYQPDDVDAFVMRGRVATTGTATTDPATTDPATTDPGGSPA